MNTKHLILYHLTVSMLLLSGCAQGYNGPMGGWDHMMGYGGYGGVFMWVILVIVVVAVVYFLFNQSK